MTWDRLTAAVLGLLVVMGGLAFAVGNQSAQHRRCVTEQHIGEGEHTQIDVGGSIWPPGTECTYHFPDGSTTQLVKHPSARAYVILATLLLLATAGPLGVGALSRSSRTRQTSMH